MTTPTHAQAEDLARAELRRKCRSGRRALSAWQQQYAALKLLLRLGDHPLLTRSQRCAFYLPNDGEISPLMLMLRALQLGKHCYLPRLAAGNQLVFHRFRPGQALQPNRFGIPEPLASNEPMANADLDLVFLPLVAFDPRGNRLGMGGGFYDRSFAFKKRHRHGPTLVGLAHECQRINKLPTKAWDVPLDYIATERDLINTRYKRVRSTS